MEAVIHPGSFEQWIALLGGVGSLVTIAISSVWRAYTFRLEQKTNNWKRFQELITLINNADGTVGHWSQLAAVSELEQLPMIHRKILMGFVDKAIQHWTTKGGHPALIEALKETQANL